MDRGIACDVAMRCIIKISIYFRVFMFLNFSETREIERINTIVGNSREKLESRVLKLDINFVAVLRFSFGSEGF